MMHELEHMNTIAWIPIEITGFRSQKLAEQNEMKCTYTSLFLPLNTGEDVLKNVGNQTVDSSDWLT